MHIQALEVPPYCQSTQISYEVSPGHLKMTHAG